MTQPIFQLVRGQEKLTIHQAQRLTAPIISDPARQLIASFQQEGRGILAAFIPFKPSEPAQLFWASPGGYSLGDQPKPQPLSSQRPEEEISLDAQSPSARGYRQAVSQALETIAAGQVQKVVLSRQEAYLCPSSPDFLPLFFQALGQANPLADSFQVELEDGSHWLGASPEILVELTAGGFYSHPLAGSLPKSVCPNPQEARQLLLASGKDREEHAYVVDHISQVLRNLEGVRLEEPGQPQILETDSIWHLGTPIRAQVTTSLSSLDLALALHPTPAIAGTPTDPACRLIDSLEASERSFYTGLVGYMDASGAGRWSLVLRCAHLQADQLTAYAGAGIVAGSDPDLEVRETGAKLKTVLVAAQVVAGQLGEDLQPFESPASPRR